VASFFEKRGWLYLDFRWRGVRCQEATKRRDAPESRAEIRRLVRQLDGEIASGAFDYTKWFPHGRKAGLFAPKDNNELPLFRDFVRGWLEDKSARIGAGTAYDWKRIVEGKLIPAFGDELVSTIAPDDVDSFVAALKRPQVAEPADVDAPAKVRKLSNRRVNIILKVLRQSLDRAVRKGWLKTNPARAVDLLREDKVQIDPLSLEEVKLLLSKGLQGDEDGRYFTVAFFSGLRPGEEIGLQWDDVDWHRKTIGVRRAVSRFGEGPTKTVGSMRDIDMLPPVERALLCQRNTSQLTSPWIFPNRDGGPLDMTNLRERVWKPALRRAGLRYRTMYQTRHTFATVMLAAGEDIGWVAKQLGHASLEMVIRRYHRFIPNLTRRDGSAASRLLADQGL
jgi:integrase